jgi:hypothetical protein
MKCLYELLKKVNGLYSVLLSSQGAEVLLALVSDLNTESLESVKYASKILLPLMTEPQAVALFLDLGIVPSIQQSVALSAGNVRYLMKLMAEMCETFEAAARVVLETGILYSEKLRQFSFPTAVSMLKIYASALKYGIEIDHDDALDQIATNVEYCLECDDEAVILLALRIAKALSFGRDHIDPDIIEGLTMHPNASIANLSAQIIRPE